MTTLSKEPEVTIDDKFSAFHQSIVAIANCVRELHERVKALEAKLNNDIQ